MVLVFSKKDKTLFQISGSMKNTSAYIL